MTTDSTAIQGLRWQVRLTRAGMLAENATRAFWPLVSTLLLIAALLIFGFQDQLSQEVFWGVAALFIFGVGAALYFGLRQFRFPSRAQAVTRLDQTLPGRPILAAQDRQIIGAGDPASEAVWRAHVEKMSASAQAARAPQPDLRIAGRDPYSLRYVAVLSIVMALLFGSVFRITSVADLMPVGGGLDLAGGQMWEGWVEPPAYTGLPSIYLSDIQGGELPVAVGSQLTLRLYGQIGDLIVSETVSGRVNIDGGASDPNQDFAIIQDGTLTITGSGGQSWEVVVIPDLVPEIEHAGLVSRGANGQLELEYLAQDDYGVQSATAEIGLNLEQVDRRYGLAAEPEPRDGLMIDLPLPIAGDRRDFAENFAEDLSLHPWVGLPVSVTLTATDAQDQTGVSDIQAILLPGRAFYDQTSAALVEQRRDLLWTRANAPRVAQVLRAVSHRSDTSFGSQTAYLKLRVAIRRLEVAFRHGALTPVARDEIAQVLWDVAVTLEDGNLNDLLDRLHQAQDRLEQAMRDGASDQEIAELMQDLRDAMGDYMRQLAEQSPQGQQSAENQQTQEITSDELQQMMDRLQELMQEGRMAEAQQLLDQLRQMMENMQVAQGGEQGEGQQALDGLADTLRDQQGLSDDTFGSLQEEFGRGANQPGAPSQQGQQGDQQGLQGQNGQSGPSGETGQGSEPGAGPGLGDGPSGRLANRQLALRDRLGQQSLGLSDAPGAAYGGVQQSLGRAGRAMEGAEDALRQKDLAGALDRQAEALEALREGMRDLSQQMAQQQLGQFGQQGEAFGQGQNPDQRDPLGRAAGSNGRIGTDEQLLQGEDVYRRAQEILDEIRRRSADRQRPAVELDYLKRLLDKF